MHKYFGILFLALGTFSCVSTTKFNQHINQPISVYDLKKDVDYAKNKLLKKQVDIDWYYPKEVIQYRLDSFKTAITHPMLPNDFSKSLMQVVASFGHGHAYVTQLDLKFTKEEKKKYKGSKNPLYLLGFKNAENRIYLEKNFSNDSTLVTNAELLAIEEYSYSDFIKENPRVRTGDGYTKVLNQNYIAPYFINYVNRKLKVRDSIVLTLQQNDSVFTQVLHRELKKKKIKGETIQKDSLKLLKENQKNQPKKILTKAEKQKAFDRIKHQYELKKYFAYDKVKKEYNRALRFPNPQDSTTVLLDVNSFALGSYKKGYEYIFDSIQKLGTKNFILDIRENGGGYPSDINHLFAYLTTSNQPQMVVDPLLKVNSKWSSSARFFQKPNLVLHTILLPYVIYKSGDFFFRTKKIDGEYYFNDGRKKDFLKKEKNRYEGNLYVLTSGKSYSAASLIASALCAEGKAILVGEETGGDYNGTVAGFTTDYTLPHSKIKIAVPMMVYQPQQKRELKGRGVFPHHEIKYHFADFLNQKDPQLEWILEDIKNKKE